jgi:hypothetical protein
MGKPERSHDHLRLSSLLPPEISAVHCVCTVPRSLFAVSNDMDLNITEFNAPPEFVRLSDLVNGRPEGFATGDEDIRTSALGAAKYAFDMGKYHDFLL